MTKAEQVRQFAEMVEDVVFKKSLLEIAKGMELAEKYKRIDMSFLQMRGENKIPKFAILPYDDFKNGFTCAVGTAGFLFPGQNDRRFPELFTRGDYFNDSVANPKVVVPEDVDAEVSMKREEFDEVLVAWEADWQPAKGDPIVIGRKGALYFIIAKWDMTELESFVADKLTA